MLTGWDVSFKGLKWRCPPALLYAAYVSLGLVPLPVHISLRQMSYSSVMALQHLGVSSETQTSPPQLHTVVAQGLHAVTPAEVGSPGAGETGPEI